MATATLRKLIEAPWMALAPIRMGNVPLGHGTPDRYITVEDEGRPEVRIDLYTGSMHAEAFAFEEAIIWGDWLVIGFGERLYLLRLSDRRTSTHELGSYFGHFYPFKSHLLVASGERLFGLRSDGELAWTSGVLGIDGVLVDRVIENTIEGQGEWDPPGGWRPFTMDLQTGQMLSGTRCEG